EEPGHVREVPPGGAGVRHRLHHVVLDGEGIAEGLGDPPHLRVAFEQAGPVAYGGKLYIATATPASDAAVVPSRHESDTVRDARRVRPRNARCANGRRRPLGPTSADRRDAA